MKFNELKLDERIQKALVDQKYTEASPIQTQTIPLILNGNDVFGCAQTGSGKTCAFVTPIINKIITCKNERRIKALILTPTRELAIQIYENIVAYGKYTNIRSLAIFGGVPEGLQKSSLRNGVDILVATPGRLLDFINQKVVNVSMINTFVLDEADRMLDMGFIHDVKKIIKIIPANRQTLMFSATLPESIKTLCSEILKNPKFVSVNPPASTVDTVEQEVIYVDKNNKTKLLINILETRKIKAALVFSKTKHGADKINKQLTLASITSAAIHGNKSQNARQKALNDFKLGKIKVLVATDIAARGIDIDYLPYVFNYDLPDVAETYVHRIGRTARAGKEGNAITFCSIDEIDMVKEIEKTCKIKIKETQNKLCPMINLTKTPKAKKPQRNPSSPKRNKENIISQSDKRKGSNHSFKKAVSYS